jgi:uncharacterized protein (TIGR03083 family)
MTQTHALDVDGAWRAIDAQRLSLAEMLDDLSEDEWRQPSLCAGWTVRDVAAHLTLQQIRLRDCAGVILRWRGTMHRTIAHEARRRAAALPVERIIAEIRGMVGSRRHNLGVTYKETLCDILVHSQDIAIPLGRPLPVPPEAAALCASRVLSMRWPPPPPSARIAARFRLTASDIPWSAGDGPEVRGPVAALLLVSCGRTVVLPQLSGDGVPELGTRLAA